MKQLICELILFMNEYIIASERIVLEVGSGGPPPEKI